MLPLGIPDFVVGFGWVSIDPACTATLAAVHRDDAVAVPARLPARGRVRWPTSTRASRRPRAVSASGPWQTFRRVTLRQIRPAVLGGCLLVTLGLLAEYGAFEILQYQTFTVAIFTEFKLGFDTVAACVLALVLVALSVAALGRRARARRTAALLALGPGRAPRGAPGDARALERARRSPRWSRCARSRSACRSARSSTGCCAAAPRTLPSASILGALGHTAALSAAAAALATVLAVPVTTLAIRHRNRLTVLIERLAYLPMALPGLVVALGLVSFSVRYALALYQSSLELIVAYAILFLPLAVVAVRSAIGAGVAAPRGGRALARLQPGTRVVADHAAADRAGPARGVRARVHLLGDRAHRDAAAADPPA